ncbi:hypothetical protein HDU87_003048 [Geranomyces variabilis]|uniref:Bro-N domain-containing protein n=1 Tax=Geranomyces variabilis TaxID=109894 RepID=A0AAD5TK86_9FUNG|nr:hypothetical protein HDU87_003048 [Geranomyces variabilis]
MTKKSKWIVAHDTHRCSKLLVTRDWFEKEMRFISTSHPAECQIEELGRSSAHISEGTNHADHADPGPPSPSSAKGNGRGSAQGPAAPASALGGKENEGHINVSSADPAFVEGDDEDSDADEGLDNFPPPPDVVTLTNSQKWADDEGHAVELETRGEMTKNGLLFRAAEVAVKLLGLTPRNLRQTLYKDAFLPGEDYLTVRQDDVRTVYISFAGVVRLLYRSNKVLARRFTDWATEKLFVLKAGDDHSQAGLVSNILGVPVEIALSILQKCPLPCAQVYLLTLGSVGKLRKTMGIKNKNAPDNHIVVKVGATGRGAAVRISEHVGGFGKIKNIEIRFVKAIWTDPHLLSTCEKEVKQYFRSHEEWKIETTGWETWRDGKKHSTAERSEIFIIPPQELDNVQKLYDAWQAKYGGGYADVLKTNEALQEALRHKEDQEAVLADLHNERLRSRDIEIAAAAREIAGRDREIELLKQQLKQAEELHQLKMEVLRTRNA